MQNQYNIKHNNNKEHIIERCVFSNFDLKYNNSIPNNCDDLRL